MNWNKLKDGNCPSCGSRLDPRGVYFFCSCGFKIREQRLKEIIEDKPKSGVMREKTFDENLSELNNFDGVEETQLLEDDEYVLY